MAMIDGHPDVHGSYGGAGFQELTSVTSHHRFLLDDIDYATLLLHLLSTFLRSSVFSLASSSTFHGIRYRIIGLIIVFTAIQIESDLSELSSSSLSEYSLVHRLSLQTLFPTTVKDISSITTRSYVSLRNVLQHHTVVSGCLYFLKIITR